MLSLMTLFVLVVLLVGTVRAETHTIEFTNKCGFGTVRIVLFLPPTFVESGRVLSTGDFTINGPLINGIAYLETGACGTSGEGCTTVQANLTDGNSCAEVSLVPPSVVL
ncbi:hypothetical protein B0H14DRAFT_2610950 [Mycena olivaceomarginata]|nr:hypothetical protein B0H14DRAFT_2610950 [Mycena olivaceomarginata]